MTILLVDGDPVAIESNSGYLASKGYSVLKAANVTEAMSMADFADCAVLDVKLPDTDGFELAVMITERKSMPFLFLTGANSDCDMERALALGGDYIKKPYSPKELWLRVAALLKRAFETEGMLLLPPMLIDTRRLSIRISGKDLFLTPHEYSILMILCRSPNLVFSHDALFKELWGDGEVSPHLVQQNVSTLRRKLEKSSPGIRFIKTVRGRGYVFRFPPETVKP